MSVRSLFRYAVATTLLCSGSSQAIQIRSYSSTDHDRFTGFPASPTFNPDFLYDASRFTGVGWRPGDSRWQLTLVSRSHLLFATHVTPSVTAPGTQIRFLSSSGSIVSRSIVSRTVIDNTDGSDSDLILLQLDSPIERDEGITPLPYFDDPRNSSYLNREAIIFGKTARAGSGNYDALTYITGSSINRTFSITYDYNTTAGGDDDAKLEVGDSGSPQFLNIDGVLGLVGINAAIDTNDDIQTNLASFVPDYVPELDEELAARGYRMIPANADTTTISESASVLTTTPRKGNPLIITITLENTGLDTTGNLEAEFHFAPGQAPDSISGAGWIDYGFNSSWTVRYPSLAGSNSSTLTLSWSEAPLVDTLAWSMESRSDKASDGGLSGTLPLADSYHSWAAGLPLTGQMEDPDLDGIPNILEYAFGSSAEDGANLLPNGEWALPIFSIAANTSSINFPERTDKSARGLSYIPEWSNDLAADSWSTTQPLGMSSATTTYAPEAPDFVKRTLSWSAIDPQCFVRIRISLEE